MIKNQWYAVAPTKIVKNKQVVALRRCGLDLALFRTESGELGCVVDKCSHRYAALSVGEVKGNCVMCPFHGLEFATDGTCSYVPASGKNFQNHNERFNLQHYAVREAHGIIYLFYGDASIATDVLPYFDDLGDEWIYSEFVDRWETHYSRGIENQLDVIHLPFIHRKTIGRAFKTLVNGPKVIFVDNMIKTSANNSFDEGQAPKRAEDCEINENMHLRFKFPNIWMNFISEKVRAVIYFAPVDDESTLFYIRFYTKLSKFAWVNRIIAFFGVFANRTIEREDKRVVVTQNPKPSQMKGGERLLPGDGPIFLYRKMRQELQDLAETQN